MKHRLTKLAVFLLLGAIVNVAVAWGIAACSQVDWNEITILDPDDAEAVKIRTNAPGGFKWSAYSSWMSDETVGVYILRVNAAELPDGRMYCQLWSVRAGWPFHNLHGEVWQDSYSAEAVYDGAFRLDKTVRMANDQTFQSFWVYPFHILMPGFILNSLFCALILWLLIRGPLVIRRSLRLHYGRCLRCGYDLRGAEHEVCPECGVETTVKVVQ